MDERSLELSTRDLKLDYSAATGNKDLLVSISRGPRSPNESGPPKTHKARLDDPDELFILTRRNELERTRNWILPAINCIVYLARLFSPIMKLRNQNRSYCSFLRPNYLFYFLQIPVFAGGFIFITASMTRILRGSSIVQKGTNVTYPFAITASIVWQWSFGHKSTNNLTVAVVACGVWFGLCLVTQITLGKQRKNNLIGVWQYPLRTTIKLRDFWLVELHVTLETIWAALVCVQTSNYYLVYRSVSTGLNVFSEELAIRMVSGGIISLLISSAVCVYAYATKRRGNSAVALAAAYYFLDAALCFSETPNVSFSPQLMWVDPSTLGRSFRFAAITAAVGFSCLAVVSLVLHTAYGLVLARAFSAESREQPNRLSFISKYFPQHKDWETTSLPTVVGRLPSEFLMRRSSSSISNGDDNLTPIRKR